MTQPAGHGVSRRSLLRATGLGAGAAVLGGGCAPSGPAVQVAVGWSGTEQAQFRRVLRGYPGTVEVIGVGDDIDAFLRARHRAGTSPDVAILSRPGLVLDYAQLGWLSPLDSSLANPFAKPWSQLLWWDGTLYGAWVKAAYKSLFWYLPSIVDSVPGGWDGLVELVGDGRAGDAPAPLAIGAADGWVLTDWFENVLAAIAPDSYDELALGHASWQQKPVRDALTLLAQLWAIPGAFVGGGERALLTQFDESVIQVTSRRAAMVFEGDFVEAVVDEYRAPGGPALGTFPFPSIGGTRPLIVGGDAAVVLHGSVEGARLVAWLARPDVFDSWIAAGGYLSPNSGVPVDRYPPGLHRELAKQIAETPASATIRFDLSDQLPSTLTGADGVGVWRILQDFFRAVTSPGGRAADAVADTSRALERAARQPGGYR